MNLNISRTSTKKGPGRMHREPVENAKKGKLPRFWTGAKNARRAIAKTLTKRGAI